MVTIVCARLLVAFMFVAAIVRLRVPCKWDTNFKKKMQGVRGEKIGVEKEGERKGGKELRGRNGGQGVAGKLNKNHQKLCGKGGM